MANIWEKFVLIVAGNLILGYYNRILPKNDSWFFSYFGYFDQKMKNEIWN